MSNEHEEAIERPKLQAWHGRQVREHMGDVVYEWHLGHGEYCYTLEEFPSHAFDSIEEALAAADGLRGEK